MDGSDLPVNEHMIFSQSLRHKTCHFTNWHHPRKQQQTRTRLRTPGMASSPHSCHCLSRCSGSQPATEQTRVAFYTWENALPSIENRFRPLTTVDEPRALFLSVRTMNNVCFRNNGSLSDLDFFHCITCLLISRSVSVNRRCLVIQRT